MFNPSQKLGETPYMSVIVSTFNRSDLIKRCLNSLLSQSYPLDHLEVIVVNDGSTDDTEDILHKHKEKIVCDYKWFSQPNCGKTKALNFAIKKSKGDIICLTDDDCIPDKDWIKNIVTGYVNEKVGGVGGLISPLGTGSFIENYTKKNKFHSNERQINIAMVGGNSSFRREVLDEIGGYDIFFRNGQDTEIGIRAQSKGYVFIYEPSAVVYHKEEESIIGILKQIHRYEKTYARLHKKYPNYFNPRRRIRALIWMLWGRIKLIHIKIIKSLLLGWRNGKCFFSEYILDILLINVRILGIVNETLFGKKYTGEKNYQKLEFIEKADPCWGWGL